MNLDEILKNFERIENTKKLLIKESTKLYLKALKEIFNTIRPVLDVKKLRYKISDEDEIYFELRLENGNVIDLNAVGILNRYLQEYGKEKEFLDEFTSQELGFYQEYFDLKHDNRWHYFKGIK